jgi:BNR/Asp-box repeat
MYLENTMNSLLRAGIYSLLGTLGYTLYSIPVFSQIATAPPTTQAQPVATGRDGQHDFDFEIGTWKTHLTRLQHPLTGSTAWVEYEGTSVVRKVWNGRANLAELNVDGAAGHIQGVSLRLYNVKSHQWSLNYANGRDGVLGQPTIGEFKNGRGEFYDQEPFDGKIILVRNVWSDITLTSCHFEQAFSEDGGKTWEVNWIATDTRLKEDTNGSLGAADAKEVRAVSQQASTEAAGQHGFDFEIGTWKIHLSRLQDRLAGSKTWVKFDGTSVTRKVLDGRANLEEFEADSSTGHIEGLTLRLYNPQTHQWRIYWANSQDPDLGQPIQPMVGEFKNGQGEFYDQELWKGRAVYVRFIWSEIMPNSAHFEQSYSDDGGKTWEVNWITDQTRDESAKH